MVNKYRPGQQFLYHESGGISHVEIVSNDSDRSYERYKLKLIKVLKSIPGSDLNVGDIFDCSKKRGELTRQAYGDLTPYVGWELSDLVN